MADGSARLTYTVSTPARTVTAAEIGKGLPSGSGVRTTACACAVVAAASCSPMTETSAAARRHFSVDMFFPLVACLNIAGRARSRRCVHEARRFGRRRGPRKDRFSRWPHSELVERLRVVEPAVDAEGRE